MYIIERLIHMQNTSDMDSSDYILSSYFLNRKNGFSSRTTLAEVEKSTFVSKSTINRFCKDCGSSNIKSFCTALTAEMEESRLALHRPMADYENAKDYIAYYKSKKVHRMINTLVKDMKDAERIFLYGNAEDIRYLISSMHACMMLGKQAISLGDWSLSQIRKKFQSATPSDLFLLIDTNYTFPMLKLKMELQEEVIQYAELSVLPCKKYFLGKRTLDNEEDITVFPLPPVKDNDYRVALTVLDELIRERVLV
ncbi:MAG: hypothetical protein IKR11_13440 [Solobacterium sp.]|nr:hypothetical protein [Solobacterium sp.]